MAKRQARFTTEDLVGQPDLDDDSPDEALPDIDDFATSRPQDEVDKDADAEGDKDKKEEE